MSNFLKRLSVNYSQTFVVPEGKERPLFKVPLHELVEQEGTIPKIVTSSIRYLEKDNDNPDLLSNANKNRVDQLKKMFERDSNVDLSSWGDSPSVAAVLRMFFERLPEPLLTCTLYSQFLEAADIMDETQRADRLQHIVGTLPPINKMVFSYLFNFLYKLTQKCDINKIDCVAITEFFGPIFLRPKLRDPRPEEIVQINAITCFMIDNCQSILTLKAHKQQYEEEKNNNTLRASKIREERALSELSPVKPAAVESPSKPAEPSKIVAARRFSEDVLASQEAKETEEDKEKKKKSLFGKRKDSGGNSSSNGNSNGKLSIPGIRLSKSSEDLRVESVDKSPKKASEIPKENRNSKPTLVEPSKTPEIKVEVPKIEVKVETPKVEPVRKSESKPHLTIDTVKEVEPFRVIAIANYFSRTHGMLDFQKGDVLEVLGERGDGWSKGRIGGQTGLFPSAYVKRMRNLKIDTSNVSMYIKLSQKRCGFLTKEQTANLKKATPKANISPTVQDVQGRMRDLKGWPPMRGASPITNEEVSSFTPQQSAPIAIERRDSMDQIVGSPESPKLTHLTRDRPGVGMRRRPSIVKRPSGLSSPTFFAEDIAIPSAVEIDDPDVLRSQLQQEREEKQKLLEELAALRQQLDEERALRHIYEAELKRVKESTSPPSTMTAEDLQEDDEEAKRMGEKKAKLREEQRRKKLDSITNLKARKMNSSKALDNL